MNTIDGIIEDLELEDSCVGGCTTKGEIIECLENLKILQKEKETVLQALEDVRAEINKEIEDMKEVSHLTIATKTYMSALVKCRQMIDRKIAEVKGE